MKLLLWYMENFSYKTAAKGLEGVSDLDEEGAFQNAVVGFVHLEEKDAEAVGSTVTKLIKNLKWLAGKWNTKQVVLHSFAHLAESKASADVVREVFARARERLEASGYTVGETPIGYFLDIHIDAPGRSLARVWKSF